MASYKIETVQPSIIIGGGGRPINGFLVRVNLIEYDEVREIELATDEPQAIHDAVTESIARRKALDELASES